MSKMNQIKFVSLTKDEIKLFINQLNIRMQDIVDSFIDENFEERSIGHLIVAQLIVANLIKRKTYHTRLDENSILDKFIVGLKLLLKEGTGKTQEESEAAIRQFKQNQCKKHHN